MRKRDLKAKKGVRTDETTIHAEKGVGGWAKNKRMEPQLEKCQAEAPQCWAREGRFCTTTPLSDIDIILQ